MSKRILVVEDDFAIQELLRLNLTMSGFSVTLASSCDEGLERLESDRPDLMLLDWNLPGNSGVWMLRKLRAEPAHRLQPVIMLTARDCEHDKVLALETGADDYVTKPFRVRELLARVKSLLRRADVAFDQPVLDVDGLCFHLEQHRAMLGDQTIALSLTEYKLLHFLATHPLRVYSRHQLLGQVWGHAGELQDRTVDAYVARLRNALDAAGHYPCIETVRSVGYRFALRPQVEPDLGISAPERAALHG
jgi:two-component system phosphate regulon response regulator PhoB